MRVYIELVEIPPEGSIEEGDFIRVDVTGWSESDVNEAIRLLREQAQVYEHYVLQVHYCGHDEGKGCSVMVLESR